VPPKFRLVLDASRAHLLILKINKYMSKMHPKPSEQSWPGAKDQAGDAIR
jgi:hypothetical protein